MMDHFLTRHVFRKALTKYLNSKYALTFDHFYNEIIILKLFCLIYDYAVDNNTMMCKMYNNLI